MRQKLLPLVFGAGVTVPVHLAVAAPMPEKPSQEAPALPDKSVEAVRCGAAPSIDGKLTDPTWRRAPAASDFWQREPNEGQPPEFETEFRVAYDDEAIYVAIDAFDPNPDEIRALLTRRDEESSSDWLWVGIDSYQDKRTAFVFGINPAGVQRDSIHYDDTQEDPSWDAVWEGAARLHDRGWSAELKIPLSQLRFSSGSDQTWGLQVAREVERTNEVSFWSPVPSDRAQFVSLFGRVDGIRDITPPRRLEIQPYVVGGARLAPADPGDPFADEVTGEGSFGLDVKYGITSNLTLSATINPDFGQVEADPSQVNLTAQETFFAEKRPFFVEGADILRFSLGQGDGDGSVETLFYSRRIGAPPHASGADHGDYVHEDPTTSIIGAAKLSGKTSGGWSVGLMNALTDEEVARVQTADGTRLVPVIEPFTSYTVGKVEKDLSGGRTSVGGAFTAVHRDLEGTDLGWLHSSAYAGGLRATHRFAGNAWDVDLRLAGSLVNGSAEAIDRTQRASQRYYQRPDADHLDYDPERTSLAGIGSLGHVGRTGKHWSFATGFDTRSPGLEVNDLGFQRGADYITNWLWIQRKDNERGDHLQSYSINLNAWSVENWGGELVHTGGNVNANVTHTSYWGGNAGINVGWDRLLTGHLRGGPAVRGDRFFNTWLNAWSDSRKSVRANAGGSFGGTPAADTWWGSVYLELAVQARSNLVLSAGPSVSTSRSDSQYVTETTDTAGDIHYVLARIQQTTAALTLRASYTVSPTLSIQLYAQPFVAAGDYTDFKEPADPRAQKYTDRYHTFTASELMDPGDGTLTATRDGQSITFSRPDFNVRELRSNLVLRWEYMPGSTLFLIWSQGRTSAVSQGDFDLGSDLADLVREDGEHVALAKLTYWWGL